MPAHARRSALCVMAAVALLALAPPCARADPIPVRSADLRVEEGDVLLSAQFDLTLTQPLQEALEKGIPLYFDIEFELTRPRRFWMDEKVAHWSITYRVSYNALTRQYRVASGPLAGASFDSLDDVQRFVGRVSSRPVARVDSLSPSARYDAVLRMKLDSNQLPKPFQLNALASRDWQLDSEPYRWSFTP
jgi:hypothetical protein